MQIKVNGVTISVENSPVTTGNLAKQESLASIIASQESAMVDIARSEEAMDTTIKICKNFSDKQLLKGQEGFKETMTNVGNAIVGFLEKILHAITQFIGKKVAQLHLNALEKRIAAVKNNPQFSASSTRWVISESLFDAIYSGDKNQHKAVTDQIDSLLNNIKFNAKAKNGFSKIRNIVVSDLPGYINDLYPRKPESDGMASVSHEQVEKAFNDAKANFNKLITEMQTTSTILNETIKKLKEQDKADAGDSRAIGKFSNTYFKLVFGYYRIIGALKPAAAEKPAEKPAAPKK